MTDKWKDKYLDLLEKHNDQIDTLLDGSDYDGPSLLILIKFMGDIDKSQIDDWIIEFREKTKLTADKAAIMWYGYLSTSQDIDIKTIPLRDILTGKSEVSADEIRDTFKELANSSSLGSDNLRAFAGL